jgi:hypothetical protein
MLVIRSTLTLLIHSKLDAGYPTEPITAYPVELDAYYPAKPDAGYLTKPDVAHPTWPLPDQTRCFLYGLSRSF